MGRFKNADTGIVVSVDDNKDDRFVTGWDADNGDVPAKKAPARKQAASSKSED